MFSLTRKEQIALCFLAGALLVGGIVSIIDYNNPNKLKEFRVVPGEPPSVSDGQPSQRNEEIEGKLDINQATKSQLRKLPGIGPVLAQRIINFRKKRGPFKSLEDLKQVSGIGEATLKKLGKFVKVGE